MYYVYLLKSIHKQYYYTGYTEDLRKRFALHQQGLVKSTKPYSPYDIVYYEVCCNKKDALLREKYLKSRRGKLFLKYRLRNWFLNNNNIAGACTNGVSE